MIFDDLHDGLPLNCPAFLEGDGLVLCNVRPPPGEDLVGDCLLEASDIFVVGWLGPPTEHSHLLPPDEDLLLELSHFPAGLILDLPGFCDGSSDPAELATGLRRLLFEPLQGQLTMFDQFILLLVDVDHDTD